MSRRPSPFVFLLLAISLMARAAAQESPSDALRAKRLEQMREIGGSIKVLAEAPRPESAVKLKAEPILRYADDTRHTHESSLWVWSGGGRPTALLALEYYPTDPRGPQWLYEIASLSPERIAAECAGSFRWTAEEPGLKLRPLAGAPPAAEKEARRLAQMKKLRDRFTAQETATIGGRIELRPLVTPLWRYADAKQNLVDGAIFSFANGTNPEVLLVLEAQVLKGEPVWQYALVQLTGEAVAVQLDGKEVWQQKGDSPPAVRASYINGWIAAEQEKE